MPVSFQNKSIVFHIKNKTILKNWVKQVIEKEKKSLGKVAYVFCTDEELLEINQNYLKHNTFTDIITFDYVEGNVISGEIFISIDRVKENSEKYKTIFEDELRRVMIHGVLHLCGFKDKKKEQEEEMRAKEKLSLKLYDKLIKIK